MLRRKDIRLLTVVGPPGIGKTRLATQVALDLEDEFEDVYFVPLAPITDPTLVLSTIAQTLSVREEASHSLFTSLVRSLRDRRVLLCIDNFEQLLPAASHLAELLTACPQAKMLVTSRAVLRLRGEKEFRVPPFALPNLHRLLSLETLAKYPAIALFTQRAQDARPDFSLTLLNVETIAEICVRLDGLPLAIELAAARLKLLSPQMILKWLSGAEGQSRFSILSGGARDLPARQQTLRNAIAWSYNLLDEEEKTLFRRLSIFVGGCTVEAAAMVCAPRESDAQPARSLVAPSILDGLSSLIDKSLLTQQELTSGDPRFVTLQTIREFGLECLADSGEREAMQTEYAAYFLSVAENAERGLVGPQQLDWLNRLEAEHDNLRAVLAWAIERADTEVGIRVAAAIWRFWFARGYFSEGRRWIEQSLRTYPDASGQVKAKALRGLGGIAWSQGDYAASRTFQEESLEIYRGLNYPRGVAASLNNLAVLAREQGDLSAARALLVESLAIRRQLGDPREIAVSLNNVGMVAREQGDLEPARAFAEEGLALAQQLGFKQVLATSMDTLGHVEHAQGNLQAAESLFKKSLAGFRELDTKREIAGAFEGLAIVVSEQGSAERAARFMGVAEAIRESIGAPVAGSLRAESERNIAAVRAQLDEKTFADAWASGRALSLDQAIQYALGKTFHAPAPISSSLPPSILRIFALGPTQVMRGEVELTSSDWVYAKTKELLFYLLFHPSSTKEQIGLALWRDASPARLRSSLGVAVHYLRRALGKPDWIILDGDHYSFNRSLPYWIDVEEFENNLERAKQLPRSAAQAVEWEDQTIGLYRGDFLQDIDAEWCVPWREELRRKLLDALISWSQSLIAASQYGQAAEMLRRALALDDLLEIAHRELIRCLARMGERGQALRHYQELVDLMQRELGAPPGRETSMLYERLRNGEEI